MFVPFLAENKRSKSEAKVARFGKTSVQPEIQDRLLLRGRPPARAPTRSSPEDLQAVAGCRWGLPSEGRVALGPPASSGG